MTPASQVGCVGSLTPGLNMRTLSVTTLLLVVSAIAEGQQPVARPSGHSINGLPAGALEPGESAADDEELAGWGDHGKEELFNRR